MTLQGSWSRWREVLLALDAGVLDDLGPLLLITLNNLRELAGTRLNVATQSLLDLGRLQDLRDFGIEAIDDRFRCARRSQHTKPGCRFGALVPSFGERRNVRQGRRALRRRDRERPQMSRVDLREGGFERGNEESSTAANQVGESLRGPLVRDMRGLDVGCLLE